MPLMLLVWEILRRVEQVRMLIDQMGDVYVYLLINLILFYLAE